jgi:hypothetical protein
MNPLPGPSVAVKSAIIQRELPGFDDPGYAQFTIVAD